MKKTLSMKMTFFMVVAGLTQVGCRGGGFTTQDSKLLNDTPIAPFEMPKSAVPEVEKPKTTESVTEPGLEPIPTISNCTEEYIQKHNEIYKIFARLAVAEKQNTPEAYAQKVTDLHLASVQCKDFEEQFSDFKCKVTLKSSGEDALASYKDLLATPCQKVEDALAEMNKPHDSLNEPLPTQQDN